MKRVIDAIEINESRPEEELFESFRELAGNRYDLVAYLFFVKDWTRFMPIVTTTFDTAFRLLELDVVTKKHWSWENYQQFNDALRAVQRRLRDVGGMSETRLIDADPFCWILARIGSATRRMVTILPPELLTGVTAAQQELTDGDCEFNDVDDEWFSLREANRRRIGKLAQEVALLSERERLRDGEPPNLEGAVQPVWHQPGRGYDILSEELDRTPRHIEVKAARRHGGALSFFVTANEWKTAQMLAHYWFYLVFEVESEQPTVQMLPVSNVSQDCLAPTNYIAAIQGQSH